jgi:molybdopterin converting factor small subunit
VRLFAAAREAVGASTVSLDASDHTVDEVLARLCAEHAALAGVLACSRVWVNGDEPARGGATVVGDGDEIAVLPPVSGGEEGCRGTPLVASSE